VWFPDSALKTAQAIEEFGLEGLPLFILANWRGFSGGQRDLFEGVLQVGERCQPAAARWLGGVGEGATTRPRPWALDVGNRHGLCCTAPPHKHQPALHHGRLLAAHLGPCLLAAPAHPALQSPAAAAHVRCPPPRQAGSLIVDHLRTYSQPVMVYLPPGCELRGGAWVVIDSQINADMVEMYADDTAQGAVLEPQGVVEIKFRAPELVAAMHRLDPVILRLKADGSPGCEAAIRERERQLLPVYHQVAVQFAQMHDGPARMLSKRVLRGIVPWRAARAFFVARLKRRLTEEALVKHIAGGQGGLRGVGYLEGGAVGQGGRGWEAGDAWNCASTCLHGCLAASAHD
jgi:hypothetical protein